MQGRFFSRQKSLTLAWPSSESFGRKSRRGSDASTRSTGLRMKTERKFRSRSHSLPFVHHALNGGNDMNGIPEIDELLGESSNV